MGLRRRLSKKWNETVDGFLTGPGVDVDSVNTGSAQIDDQENWVLLSRTTNDGTFTVDTSEYDYVKAVTRTVGNGLTLTIDGNTDTNYNQLSLSDSGIASSSGAEFVLHGDEFSNTNYGVWHIANDGGLRVSVFGQSALKPLSNDSLIRGFYDNPTPMDTIELTDVDVSFMEVYGRQA